jgi:peptidoglycan/xylan/chitin deacetylase (PgdA/CDA1 family)
VLAYHGLGDIPLRDDPHGLFVHPRRLRAQVRTLRRWGYRLVTARELGASSDRDGLAALTFDDGFSDNVLLSDLDAPATVFVVSGWLGQPHPDAPGARMLSAEQVRSLHDAGVEIGGHTATHPDLTALEPAAARDELEAGRLALEELTGAPVDSIAYPYGRANSATREAARAAGFRAGFRTSAQGNWDDPLDLPRQDVENATSGLSLRLMRDDRYEPLMSTVAGRGARRLVRRARSLVR